MPPRSFLELKDGQKGVRKSFIVGKDGLADISPTIAPPGKKFDSERKQFNKTVNLSKSRNAVNPMMQAMLMAEADANAGLMTTAGFGGGLYSPNSVASHGNKTYNTSNAGHMNPKLMDV